MKRICFTDRDGTLLIEPSITKQINGLDEMAFLPNVISSLKRLTENGWELVMITNQDGLGNASNPRENYDQINRKLLEIFASENIIFLSIYDDNSFADNPSENRKPATGMVDKFLKENNIDFDNSFVVGDRESDIEFAENIGVRGFLLGEWNWSELTKEVIDKPRKSELSRTTNETKINMKLNLDGSGSTNIKTGLNFFDHMLEQLGKHAGFDLDIQCVGDLQIDEHHTIEDTALLLGEVFNNAIGDKRGIERYAHEKIIIMDESKCEIALDISGRPYLVFDADFKREYVGDFPTELLEHFFFSFSQKANIALNIKLTGKNHHHLIEVAFKGLARALKDAVKRSSTSIPSTKGSL